MKISDIQSIEILDSRGNPTVRSFITLDDNTVHTASVPSGASTGTKEAVELRDNDNARYGGKGVLRAIENVNTTIRDALLSKEADPKTVDQILIELDGTANKEKLGANAILSVSMSIARAAAHAQNVPLWKYLNEYYFSQPPETSSQKLIKPSFPRLMVNVINGGVHANWNFDIQEFMIVPNSAAPSVSIPLASEVFHSLGKLLKEKGLSTLVGDEGGYSPALSSNEQAFEIILDAAKSAGYENVADYRFAIDAASSEFYKDGIYTLDAAPLNASQLTEYYSEIGQKFKLLSFEDAFSEDDFSAHKKFTQMAKEFDFITIGDDLFCTNPALLKKGIEEKLANGILIKLNQIGTVSETCNAINLAKQADWKVAISHRSGETEDNFIADLAYSCAADFLKSGSMARSERLSKYNRLLEIECNL